MKRISHFIKQIRHWLVKYRWLILKVIAGLVVVGVLWFVLWVGSIYFGIGRTKSVPHEAQNNATGIVKDITGLYQIQTKGIIVPHTTEEIQKAVMSHDKVSIGGGRYSMGGQTASTKAIQIDMREFNKILNLSTTTKEITVQAGIRWKDIQEAIDPYDLSVQIMQTYSNFSVGGSLSVNVHGRYIGQGPVVMSVKKIQIVLADGKIVEATPDVNRDIFYSAIGGMGGMGVVTEVTLGLADNVRVARERVTMPISEYTKYFSEHVKSSGDVVFHNGDIYPMDFDTVSAVSWKKTDKPVTTETRLVPRNKDYWLDRAAWIVMSEWPFGKAIRQYVFEPLLYLSDVVHTRNYEASYDVAELEPESRDSSTYVLQEYFVPVEKFNDFYPKMKEVFVGNDVNILNVSIRHADKDPGSLMAWARSEVFAFVVYYKQGTDQKSKDGVARWTREMIDQVIAVGGTYYLPYQPWATDEQFHRAYPNATAFFEMKKKFDPTDKFTNNLWDTYYSSDKLSKYEDIHSARQAASLLADYVRPQDNMYLTLPEWYIVYSADEYANVLRDSLPSQFDYRSAVKQYWSEYKTTQALAQGSVHQNSGYKLVLRVIGWSFTFENDFKWLYENTIGRMSEWFAGNHQVEEDRFAAKVAHDYAVFIYDYPWYDFPYYKYYAELGNLPSEKASHSFGEWIRKIERRVFLRAELGVKRLYSWIIQKATHAKFGVQDDVIYALTKEGGVYGVVSAPHYQTFTRALLEKIHVARASQGDFKVLEIAGNTKITFVYLDAVGALPVASSTEVVRHVEVQAVVGGVPVLKDRITVLVDVGDLVSVISELENKGIEVDHVYDY